MSFRKFSILFLSVLTLFLLIMPLNISSKLSDAIVLRDLNDFEVVNVSEANRFEDEISTKFLVSINNSGYQSQRVFKDWMSGNSGSVRSRGVFDRAKRRFESLDSKTIWDPDYQNNRYNGVVGEVVMANTHKPLKSRTDKMRVIYYSEPGTIEIWGEPLYGLSEVPDEDVIFITSGDYHAVALKADGGLIGWGAGLVNTGTFPHYGQSQVPAGNDFTAIAAGDLHSLALRENGSLSAWGRNNHGQTSVPGGQDYIFIACGGMHSLAIRENGSIAAWGAGVSDTGIYPHFGQSIAPLGNDFVMVAAGTAHSIALKTDGTLLGWGRNNYGQINVPTGNDFVAISANNYHNLAMRADGSIVAWGRNTSGQCNVLPFTNYVFAAAGREHSLAVKNDGSLSAWGMNSWGQSNVPGGNHYTMVAGGYQHSLAISSVDFGLISPNGGEVWQSGTEKEIRWFYRGNDTVISLLFSEDGGENWLDLGSVSALANSYSWTVPFTLSANCLIRGQFVVDFENYEIESEAFFAITADEVPDINLIYPDNEGLQWQVGKVYEISWQSNDVVSVDLLYSINNGYSWIGIANDIPANTSSYVWTIPDIATEEGRIKIRSSENYNINDVSSHPFKIVKLNFINDFGGTELVGGEELQITLTAANLHRIVLSYSLDGDNWTLITNNLTQTTYNWMIPNINSAEAMLRITDYYDEEIFDISESFVISSLITLLHPIGGENLRVGYLYQIEWAADESVANVVIDYSVDNGLNWIPIRVIPYPAGAGSFNWLIPNNQSDECLVRVLNTDNSNILGQSSNPFTISDKNIVLIHPYGDDTLYPEEIQPIYWQHENLEVVNIDFSYDSGDHWLAVAESISANSSPYMWEIPKIGTNRGKLRIYHPDNEMISSISVGVLTIVHYNSPLNLTAELSNHGVELSWDTPYGFEGWENTSLNRTEQRSIRFNPTLLGYNVYMNGTLRNDVPIIENWYLESDPVIGAPNIFFVTAVYEEEESEPSNSVEVFGQNTDEYLNEALVTSLLGNYPNPFNPHTHIQFSLANSQEVRIDIYSVKGQRVRTLVNRLMPAGKHTVLWDGKVDNGRLAVSGIYFFCMKTKDYKSVGKMVMIK